MNKLINVLVVKDWDYPDFFRQSPGGEGKWENVKFLQDPSCEYEFVIVFNWLSKNHTFHCPPENIWLLMQEPPNEYFRVFHNPPRQYRRVFTQDTSQKGKRYVLSQPCTPWHIDFDYNALLSAKIPTKTKLVSCILSNKQIFRGQKQRLSFLTILKKEIDLDHFGYGFEVLKNKWDGLSAYEFSIILENFSNPFYFTEKILDCYLSWTFPIYHGCTNLSDFFPSKSFFQFEINDSHAPEKIKKALQTISWKERVEALSEARNLVLKKYQFFPYFAEKITDWKRTHVNQNKEYITLKNQTSRAYKLYYSAKRLLSYE